MRTSYIDKILDDVLDFKMLLKEYFSLANKNDVERRILTESEKLTKEGIIKDMQTINIRLSNDIKAFSKSVCNSEQQRDNENRNLVDLAGEFVNVLLRLKRFKEADSDLRSSFDSLKRNRTEFSDVLDDYIEKSNYKVYSWKEALEVYRQEEDNLF